MFVRKDDGKLTHAGKFPTRMEQIEIKFDYLSHKSGIMKPKISGSIIVLEMIWRICKDKPTNNIPEL
jgi:hypothetical protein